jgi:aminobenzoyl-glutamate transport protein
MFAALCLGVIFLSQLMAWAGVHATYEVVKPPAQSVDATYVGGSVMPSEVMPAEPPAAGDYRVVTETVAIRSLLNADGIRYLFTSFVPNFMGFTAMGIILIVMIGVGVAERSGLIAAMIRGLVASSPPAALTYIVVFLGIISSIASDAGYLVLIPLGAAAFASVGRHPLAGMAAAFAGVAGGFGVNLMVTPTDAVLTEITNESAHLVDPNTTIDLTANLWFGIGSTIMLTALLGVVTTRVVERRLGSYDPRHAPTLGAEQIQAADDAPDVDPGAERKGLRQAGLYFLVAAAVILLLTLPPGAPLRDPETGSIIGTSPFMNSLIVIISLLFLAAGLGYGRGAGTIGNSTQAIDAVTKSWAGLSGLLLLFLLIAQFIAYFNYSNMPQVAAVKIGDLIEGVDVGAGWLLLAAIGITLVVGIILPQAIAKWALLAPIFVPVFMRLGIGPEVVLAAYRVGDSPMNIVTPIMAYFPLIVIFAARYDKRSGIGTVIALMLPYFAALAVAWTAFFMAWYLLGLPWGLAG